jgi:hypothetical protein
MRPDLSKPLQEFCQQVIAENDRGWKIRQAMHFGSDAVNVDADNGWWRRKSTRRAIFWENAVNKLVELTADDRACQVVRHHDTVSFIFDDAVLVRLKKADMALRTSNIPTTHAQLFHDHRTDLFGYTGLQRVEAVYIPNRFETGIFWSGIVAREKKAHLWHFEITEPVVVPVVPIPQPVQPPAASLVRLRNQAKDAKREKKDGDK